MKYHFYYCFYFSKEVDRSHFLSSFFRYSRQNVKFRQRPNVQPIHNPFSDIYWWCARYKAEIMPMR